MKTLFFAYAPFLFVSSQQGIYFGLICIQIGNWRNDFFRISLLTDQDYTKSFRITLFLVIHYIYIFKKKVKHDS